MKYYKGDIIEIITSDYQNANEFVKAGNSDRKKCKEFIGQRFTLDSVVDDYLVSTNYGDSRYSETFFIKRANCSLYRRPLINHIKSIFNL